MRNNVFYASLSNVNYFACDPYFKDSIDKSLKWMIKLLGKWLYQINAELIMMICKHWAAPRDLMVQAEDLAAAYPKLSSTLHAYFSFYGKCGKKWGRSQEGLWKPVLTWGQNAVKHCS